MAMLQQSWHRHTGQSSLRSASFPFPTAVLRASREPRLSTQVHVFITVETLLIWALAVTRDTC